LQPQLNYTFCAIKSLATLRNSGFPVRGATNIRVCGFH
jgi:hypothetical protein